MLIDRKQKGHKEVKLNKSQYYQIKTNEGHYTTHTVLNVRKIEKIC